MNAASNLSRSVELLDSFWSQLNDLVFALSKLTEDAIKSNSLAGLQSAGGETRAHRLSDSGWVYTETRRTFPVKPRKSRSRLATGYLHYQFSIGGSGIAPLEPSAATGDSIGPLLHVSYWQSEMDYAESGYRMEFPCAWDDFSLRADRLIYWQGENDKDSAQWTYSLRLLDMHDEDTLRASVISPLRQLLAGVDPIEALPDNLPGLVFYRLGQTGDGHSELFARRQPGHG